MRAMSNPYAPPVADVRDVGDPLAPVSLAGRGARFIAASLDGLLLGAIVYIPLIASAALGFQRPAGIAVLALACGAIFVYGLVTYRAVVANGQTIGKRMMGIKVVRSDGSAISVTRIFWLRNVINGLISAIPLYGFVDLMFIFGQQQRCLHDRIADTIVINA